MVIDMTERRYNAHVDIGGRELRVGDLVMVTHLFSLTMAGWGEVVELKHRNIIVVRTNERDGEHLHESAGFLWHKVELF